MAFQYSNQGGSLTASQEVLLERIENSPSPFKDISKLKDLRSLTGVLVVVSDRGTMIKLLNDYTDQIREQYGKYNNDPNYRKAGMQIERADRSLWASERLKDDFPLLGLYSRTLFWYDDFSPTVYLFADNIYDHASFLGKDPDLVFGYVFIHEMMHAYYDSLKANGYPSWEPLEEAFAEFGMLTFLKMNPSLPPGLLAEAMADVQYKIDNGPREYGFGKELFERTLGGDPEMIDNYREISNWIDCDSKWSNNYFNDIRTYRGDPSDDNAKKCFDDVINILKYDWKPPTFIIQRGIRGSRSSIGSGKGSVPAKPKLSKMENWALTATQIGWDALFPLIRKDDIVQLLTEVVKVMKNEGFEQYLSLDGIRIRFFRKSFSGYTTNPKHKYSIPESLSIQGNSVYPVFALSAVDPVRSIGHIIYALSFLFDNTFTLVHEDSSYVLYGPAKFISIFSTTATASAIGTKTVEQAFVRFMEEQCYISDRTIKKYSSDVPNSPGVQRIIMDVTAGATNNMYHVTDIAVIDQIIACVSSSVFDKNGRQMYSSGLKKYREFLAEQ